MNSAHRLARVRRSQTLESEHLLKALLEQKDLAVRILETAAVDVAALDNNLEQFLARQPRLGAPPDTVSMSSSLGSTAGSCGQGAAGLEGSIHCR